MSQRVKKTISSMSYSFNRVYQRISTMKLSTFVLSVIVMAIAIFLFAGGVYDVVYKPYPAIYSNATGSFIFLYPQLSSQFLGDSVFAAVCYSIGLVGLIAMYQSTKYAYKPRQAYFMLVLGIVLFFLAYAFLEVTIHAKGGP
jgi:hypothetical protein